jgi:hypothetical protein
MFCHSCERDIIVDCTPVMFVGLVLLLIFCRVSSCHEKPFRIWYTWTYWCRQVVYESWFRFGCTTLGLYPITRLWFFRRWDCRFLFCDFGSSLAFRFRNNQSPMWIGPSNVISKQLPNVLEVLNRVQIVGSDFTKNILAYLSTTLPVTIYCRFDKWWYPFRGGTDSFYVCVGTQMNVD